jgi:hypothetical protein
MTKTTKGVLWIVVPFLVLPLVLVAWALLSFVFSSVLATNAYPSAGALATSRIVNIVLGFIGMLSVIMVPVGVVVGVVTLVQKPKQPPTEPPEQPFEPPTMDHPM